MISPHTPPGTKIVCVDDTQRGQFSVNGYVVDDFSMHGLRSGDAYTVTTVIPCKWSMSGFIVALAEIRRPGPLSGYDLARFRYAELPKSITDCLTHQDLPLEVA